MEKARENSATSQLTRAFDSIPIATSFLTVGCAGFVDQLWASGRKSKHIKKKDFRKIFRKAI